MNEVFQKITEEDVIKGGLDEKLVSKVKEYYCGNMLEKEYEQNISLVNCESPIEQLLALALEENNIGTMGIFNPFIDVLSIENQKEIDVSVTEKVRVDFLITVMYKNQGLSSQDGIVSFVVECDGHEFHQKTKEQVEKDNIRTRKLQLKGYEVLRFSGSEIYKSPYKVATDIIQIILSKCEYKKDL